MQWDRQSAFLAVVGLVALVLAACGGTLPADLPSEIELEADEIAEELEFSGVVESINDSEWTVDGLTFAVSGATEIGGGITTGSTVKVRLTLTDSDRLIAREIELEESTGDEGDPDVELRQEAEEGNADGELEFFGVVSDQTGDHWTIDGRTILLTDATEINGAIMEGDLVKVHAFVDAGGQLTAREIERADEDDHGEDDEGEAEDHEHNGDEVEFVGVLESMDGDQWIIDGTLVFVTDGTELEGDLQHGAVVNVEATQDENGNLLAREIEREDEGEKVEDGDLDDEDDEDDHEEDEGEDDEAHEDHDEDDHHDDEEDDEEKDGD